MRILKLDDLESRHWQWVKMSPAGFIHPWVLRSLSHGQEFTGITNPALDFNSSHVFGHHHFLIKGVGRQQLLCPWSRPALGRSLSPKLAMSSAALFATHFAIVLQDNHQARLVQRQNAFLLKAPCEPTWQTATAFALGPDPPLAAPCRPNLQ